jgi:SAM-dependent methyltransferase
VTSQGWHGWDEYAAFYDWENARTLGRRDVDFWCRVVRRQSGRLLELGCGTGRLLIPLARSRKRVVGLDRSAPMLAHARRRVGRMPSAKRPCLLRGDIRRLPFSAGSLGTVLAPYGVLQSLLTEADLVHALEEASRVLRPGGLLGIDLVPDLPVWAGHGRRVQLSGTHRGGRLTLFESVRQDRRRGLTIFNETFVEQREGAATRRRFTLTFRTQPLPPLLRLIERAGFAIEATFGDYEGAPWRAHGADAWIVLARKKRVRG